MPAGMHYWDAAFAFLVATAVAALLTPLAARFARRIGAIDFPRARGLSEHPTPKLGGLAILVAVIVAAVLWLPATIHLPHVPHAKGSGGTVHTWAILVGAGLITLVGAIDDWKPLSPLVKLIGQVAAAVVAVEGGVNVTDVTIPFVGSLQFPNEGGVISAIWLVGLMNVVNFSDGLDGLAAGLCTIDGIAFVIIIFGLPGGGSTAVAELAALTGGASLGFLFFNFPPAKVFMGDSGANLLGYLIGVVAVIGSLKTGAVVALAVPLLILAVPFLDTGFVVAKRLKYGNKPWEADRNHFHHRMANIGFTPRKTIAYLYAWTLMLAGVALALRFVPYSDHNAVHPHYRLGWSLVMGAILLLALAASVYLVYLLEILKFRGLRSRQLRESDPDTSEHEIQIRVQRDIETGEFERVGRRDGRD
jgi:UDP-GlcNAc:undecaprenyl-phosphate GlcNAc-1-phosphate transferase